MSVPLVGTPAGRGLLGRTSVAGVAVVLALAALTAATATLEIHRAATRT